MTTLLLTGLPRSGTTLACALLNTCPDTVALAEPLRLERHGDRDRAVAEIEAFLAAARRQLREEGRAPSLHVGGIIPDNWAAEPTAAPGRRPSRAERGLVRFTQPLSADFHLIVKHPGEFSALLDLLAPRHPLLALVRDPLAVLASWQTVDFPVGTGHLPVAEAFNPELAALLAGIDRPLARQVALLDWLLRRYLALLGPERILRYEDLTTDPAAVLARFGVQPPAAGRTLAPLDPARRYPSVDLRPLAAALLPIAPACEPFYPGFAAALHRRL